MSGEPIEAVRQGMRALVAELKSNPQALETTFLSVITFNSSAQQVAPLTDLASFREPTIDASGATALGEALKTLRLCIDREVTKTTRHQRGDRKPLVFLVTDGQPTDSWEREADDLKQQPVGNIIACAAGGNSDENLLKRITESVVKLNSQSPDALMAYFKWVSSTIKTTSDDFAQTLTHQGSPLPPLPPQITSVP